MVEIGVSPDRVKQVMNIIEPYLTSVRDHLLSAESVNSEQRNNKEFTVHTDREQEDE